MPYHRVQPQDFTQTANEGLSTRTELNIKNNFIDPHVISTSSKKFLRHDGKKELERNEVSNADDDVSRYGLDSVMFDSTTNIVKVSAVFYGDTIRKIKFMNNKRIPRILLQVFGLAIGFHTLLTSITINKGMDKYTLHELAQILDHSNVNDLNFDDALFEERNYDLLLQRPSKLKSLSLARCKIEDSIVIKIAERLEYTATGCNTLAILNLSSNQITNVGARALGEALRSNRTLNYLNLANNWIDDEGALSIFKVLQPFLLTNTEIQSAKTRRLVYLRKLNNVMSKKVQWLKSTDGDKGKKKQKPTTVKSKSLGDDSAAAAPDGRHELIYAEAKEYAKNLIGEYDDPFYFISRFNGFTYCTGNYALAYLNLAYNNLSYCILKPIVIVLEKQRSYCMNTSGGLVCMVLEGNPLPDNCKELKEIEMYMELQIGRNKKLARRLGPTAK